MVVKRQSSPGCVLVVGLFFLGLASVFLVIAAESCFKAGHAQRSYRSESGLVQESYMTTTRSSKGRVSFVRHVRYSYPCPSGTCQGTTIGGYGFFSGSLSYADTEAWLSIHRPGSQITVFVDPSDPRETALELEPGSGPEFILLFPMLHWAVGLIILLSAFRLDWKIARQIVGRAWFTWGLLSLLLAIWASVPTLAILVGHAIYFGLGAVVALRVPSKPLTIVR